MVDMDMFSYFGPSEKHYIPPGGFCISVFAFIRNGNRILLVRPVNHEKWIEWAPNWRGYSQEALDREMRSWRFPSSYVKIGEHPDMTLGRVMEDQLEIKEFRAGNFRLFNYYTPSRRYPGEMHWDYCFIYEVQTNTKSTTKPWLDAVDYISIEQLKEEDFGSGQGGLLEIVTGAANQPPR